MIFIENSIALCQHQREINYQLSLDRIRRDLGVANDAPDGRLIVINMAVKYKFLYYLINGPASLNRS